MNIQLLDGVTEVTFQGFDELSPVKVRRILPDGTVSKLRSKLVNFFSENDRMYCLIKTEGHRGTKGLGYIPASAVLLEIDADYCKNLVYRGKTIASFEGFGNDLKKLRDEAGIIVLGVSSK